MAISISHMVLDGFRRIEREFLGISSDTRLLAISRPPSSLSPLLPYAEYTTDELASVVPTEYDGNLLVQLCPAHMVGSPYDSGDDCSRSSGIHRHASNT
ncbi:hypothetical protein BDV27DRAFT_120036 [Aspergillus caelatus]|uniref:Uncharacterized protein n=2 Tax=Aspergillus subgen. Circumdati TaxID=2720871 RepID=A0A5N7AJQ3_9EURO|nr:uncharacterized protein BDV27DRAFT_120036 [Aspergillus caelatus]KAE8370107.1 hypothetical protein BDV27DRAFT_120036 [Aspergillus caelatus]KAE8422154.1 hypothetical protein BDV36DRAFT_245983 [Aspergillus pseudocaelatus]